MRAGPARGWGEVGGLGLGEGLWLLVMGLLPLGVVGWLVHLGYRAVVALEAIAALLRERREEQ